MTRLTSPDHAIPSLMTRSTSRNHAIPSLMTRSTSRNHALLSLMTRSTSRNRAILSLMTRLTSPDHAIPSLMTRLTSPDHAIPSLMARSTSRNHALLSLMLPPITLNNAVISLVDRFLPFKTPSFSLKVPLFCEMSRGLRASSRPFPPKVALLKLLIGSLALIRRLVAFRVRPLSSKIPSLYDVNPILHARIALLAATGRLFAW